MDEYDEGEEEDEDDEEGVCYDNVLLDVEEEEEEEGEDALFRQRNARLKCIQRHNWFWRWISSGPSSKLFSSSSSSLPGSSISSSSSSKSWTCDHRKLLWKSRKRSNSATRL